MIPLKEVRFFEVVPFGGRSDFLWKESSIQGLKITEVDGKVLLEKEGYPDTMVYPAMIKYAVAKEDFGMIVGSKKEVKVEEASMAEVAKLECCEAKVMEAKVAVVEVPKVEKPEAKVMVIPEIPFTEKERAAMLKDGIKPRTVTLPEPEKKVEKKEPEKKKESFSLSFKKKPFKK